MLPRLISGFPKGRGGGKVRCRADSYGQHIATTRRLGSYFENMNDWLAAPWRRQSFHVEDAFFCLSWMVAHSQVHVLRWSTPVMAKGLLPRAWVKKSFYFQVISCLILALWCSCAVKMCALLAGSLWMVVVVVVVVLVRGASWCQADCRQ